MDVAPFISVIIPVFNTSAYLHACVTSFLEQSFSVFELILVDDGSTDGSADICDGFAANDTRVHCIHQQNGGVSSARNAGLESARGAYIWFCDSDDTVPPGALKALYLRAIETDAPMFAFPIVQVDGQGNQVGLIPAPKASHAVTDGPLQCGDPLYPQGHVFKRELAEGERFDTSLALLEDRDFFYRLSWKAAGAIAIIDEPLYHYLVAREDSAVNSLSVVKLTGAARVQYEILLNELSLGHPLPAFLDFVNHSLSALAHISRYGDVDGQFELIRARLLEQKGHLGLLKGGLKAKYLLVVKTPKLFKALARMSKA